MKCAPTDGELLMRFLQHQDEVAFENLVRRHRSSVYGVCYRVLGNSHDAEDAFQATFLVLARKARRFQTASSIGGWLFRVALRTAKNARAKKWRSKEEALNVTISSEAEPLAIIQEQELVTTLYDELGKLPEKYQSAIVLCVLEGKSRLEASNELECTVASLKARLARGRRQLRINLTRRGVAFSVALSAAASGVRVADAALNTLCENTAATCTSYAFATKSCSVSPNVLQLSEKGMSAMTIGMYSKVAATSLALLTIGIGGAMLPSPATGQAQGADDVITVELPAAKVAQSANSFSIRKPETTGRTQQTPWGGAASAVRSAATTQPNNFAYYPGGGGARSKLSVSEQASNEVVQALMVALSDNDPRVAHNAAKTLVSIGKGRGDVVEAFLKIAASSKDKKLRYYATAGLGRIGKSHPDVLQGLAAILQSDSDPVFRKAAVEAMGQLEMSDEVARALASALKDSDARVRATVASMLARLDPSHNSALRPRLSLPVELNGPTSASRSKSIDALAPVVEATAR